MRIILILIVWLSVAATEIPETVVEQAQEALSHLASGFDHRTPSPYQVQVNHLIEVMIAVDPASCDLGSEAMRLTVLSEAYAMTADARLQPIVQNSYSRFAQRLGQLGIDAPNLVETGDAFWCLMSFQSARAGGIKVDDDHFRSWLEFYAEDEDTESAVLRAVFAIYLGEPALTMTVEEHEQWMREMPLWIEEDRHELLLPATLAHYRTDASLVRAWQDALVVEAAHHLGVERLTDDGPILQKVGDGGHLYAAITASAGIMRSCCHPVSKNSQQMDGTPATTQ